MNIHFDPCGEGVREHFLSLAFPQMTVPLASPAVVANLRDALRTLLDEIVDPETGRIEPQDADSPTLRNAVHYAQHVLAETRRFR